MAAQLKPYRVRFRCSPRGRIREWVRFAPNLTAAKADAAAVVRRESAGAAVLEVKALSAAERIAAGIPADAGAVPVANPGPNWLQHVHIKDASGVLLYNRLLHDGGPVMVFERGGGFVTQEQVNRNGWQVGRGWPDRPSSGRTPNPRGPRNPYEAGTANATKWKKGRDRAVDDKGAGVPGLAILTDAPRCGTWRRGYFDVIPGAKGGRAKAAAVYEAATGHPPPGEAPPAEPKAKKPKAKKPKRGVAGDLQGGQVQAVAFAREYWTNKAAREWCQRHGFRTGDPSHTGHYFRFRQFDPEELGTGARFRTKQIMSGRRPINLIIGWRQ